MKVFCFVFTLFVLQCLVEARSYSRFSEDGELEQRGYYYIVSEWSQCNCETGKQHRTVKCTQSPCHVMRAPIPVRSCSC
ncbi:hypothetical protein AC249_AIPGENE6201 [Exaiptasia diaphana]|nr:hypothetical protein AC249_AIPGENE6201 [Exaiptasia diaphana]